MRRHRALRAGLAALLAVTFATAAESRRREVAPPPPPPSAGGLIDNVNGYAFDRGRSLVRFTGLLIGKDGRVAKLLTAADKRPERLDFRLDGHGRTLLPGLIDAHSHVMALGRRAIGLDLGEARTIEALQGTLAAYARAHATPLWIYGGGWPETFLLSHLPAAADIDAVVSDRPVVLDFGGGQGLLANGAAMAAAGIGTKTADPVGGRIERDANGRATGLFVGTAEGLILAAMPRMLPRERDEALAAAQDRLIRAGITTTTDIGTSIEDWTAFRRAGDAGRLRMVGVALVADGGLGTRGAWLKADYADAAGVRGLRFLDDAKLRNLMSRAAMDRFQVAVTATGDAAVAQLLGAIEEEAETYKGDRRWRIEGARLVDPADLPRFARNGIVASLQPGQSAADRRMAETRLGAARAAGGSVWRALPGVSLAFGSGGQGGVPAPFADIAAAVEGGGDVAGALAAYTAGAAYAGFAEAQLGSLAPGAMADFVLVDHDMIAHPGETAATQVLETWIGGKRLWVRGANEQNVTPLPPGGEGDRAISAP